MLRSFAVLAITAGITSMTLAGPFGVFGRRGGGNSGQQTGGQGLWTAQQAADFQASRCQMGHFGNPSGGFEGVARAMSAAAALANLQTIESLGLVERVRSDVGPYFQEKLHSFASHPAVAEIRGLGLIGAMELVPRGGRSALTPTSALGVRASGLIRKEGSIVRGIRDLIAVAPPLIITHAEIDQLFDSISAGLEKLWD